MNISSQVRPARQTICSAVLAALLLPLGLHASEPANKKATAGVRTALKLVARVQQAKGILAGQHVYLNSAPNEVERVKQLTGKYPAVAEFDLLGFHQDPQKRDRYLAFAKDWHAAGGLVGISWHETSPVLDALDEGGYSKGTKKRMSQKEFDQVVTPGTKLHTKWLDHVDKAALWLNELEQAGVVVFWRPYHEMTGAWFWWGAKRPETFRKLWVDLHERLTDHHGLNNLIWVWSAAQAGSNYEGYLPHDYVDITGVDIYQRRREAPEFVTKFRAIERAAKGKPVALTEVGLLPLSQTLETETEYVWFVLWGRGFLDRDHYGAPKTKVGNRAQDVVELYEHPMVITRDELGALRR